MRSWSIPVGRLFGIEIRIHLTFVFLLVFLWSTAAATQDATAALRVLGLVGIIFCSVVLHELGHALVARGSGIPAKGIISAADRWNHHPRRSARHSRPDQRLEA